MIDSNGYTIVDVETTGLYPGGGDRVIEIAIIRLDNTGQVLNTYSTLINPQRDIGATHIHGITAEDVKNAPMFQDVIGDVIQNLRGTALVAHNVSFDRRFLNAEFKRLNTGLPNIPCFCTLQLSKLIDRGVPSRKLYVLCDYFGIDLEKAHTAYADAKATAELFSLCVRRLGGWQNINPKHHCIKSMNSDIDFWPSIEPIGFQYNRQMASEEVKNKSSYIESLVEKLPPGANDDPIIDEYFTLLDRVLEDRIVDENEYSQMELLTNELDMSRDQAIAAHHQYMHHLMVVALDDGVITKTEETDLEAVRRLLNISETQYDNLLKKTVKQFEKGFQRNTDQIPNENVSGLTVCFTGAFNCTVNGNIATRSIAQKTASAAGMIVQKGVTKKLNILIVADPNSMSGKAKKAREYGIRVIAEPVFWQMVGVGVE